MKYEDVLLDGIWKWEGLSPLIDDIYGLFLEGISSPDISLHVSTSLQTELVPVGEGPLHCLLSVVLSEIDWNYISGAIVNEVVQEMVQSSRDKRQGPEKVFVGETEEDISPEVGDVVYSDGKEWTITKVLRFVEEWFGNKKWRVSVKSRYGKRRAMTIIRVKDKWVSV